VGPARRRREAKSCPARTFSGRVASRPRHSRLGGVGGRIQPEVAASRRGARSRKSVECS
jgi:hypothetical protein